MGEQNHGGRVTAGAGRWQHSGVPRLPPPFTSPGRNKHSLAPATPTHPQVGELCVRGYSVMLGYWGDEASTAAVLDADDWMHTGDLATLDPQG